MGTVYGTQSQGYESTGYQAPPRLWEHCFIQLPRHLGEKPDCLHLAYTPVEAFPDVTEAAEDVRE